MSKYLAIKMVAIVVLVVLLLIPMGMITQLIHERERYQETVVQQVANSSSGAQTIIGPILVIPYETEEIHVDAETKKTMTVTQKHVKYIIPKTLQINGKAKVTPRKLGVYQAQVYLSELNFSGSFGNLNLDELLKDERVVLQAPYFVVSVADTRGIMRTSSFNLNKKPIGFKEGVVNRLFGKGMHVPVTIEELSGLSSKNEFGFDLDIQGTQNLSIVPLGRESELNLESNWRHPNFLGSILPKTYTVSDKGFTAQWQSTWFANNINDLFGTDKTPFTQMEEEGVYTRELPNFSVSLIETVNQYQLNERSVKYAILFIGLTFIGFIVFEAIAQLKIHPVQYALVGFTLVLFYLLLLALSEHKGFNTAYTIAAVASSALIGLYLCSVLKSFVRGIGFSGGLLGLYGLLFMILQSEDYALLFGASLLFVVLALIMLVTRKIDWYQVTGSLEKKPVQKPDRARTVAAAMMPEELFKDVDISALDQDNDQK